MPYKSLVYLFISLLLLQADVGQALQSTDWDNSAGNNFAEADLANKSLTRETADPEFLKVDEAYQVLIEVSKREILLNWQIAEGYYLYKNRFKFSLSKNGKNIPISPLIPTGKKKHDEFFGEIEAHYYNVMINLPLPADISGPLRLDISSQGCADAGLCYPPYNQRFDIGPSLLTAEEIKTNSIATQTADTPQSGSGLPLTTSNEKTNQPSGDNIGFITILFLAGLGGMILNLMPCVFPILTLKFLSLSSNSAEMAAARTHGIVYTIGVVVSFMAVAGVLIMLQSSGEAIGWGFHLQSPWFVASLTYLFFVLGLSMSGMLEIGARFMGIGSSLAEQSGHSGSFFTGVLAVVVASPCTAPFMGTALGYAMSQPAVVALSVFAALGFGMALPFLILSFSPTLIRFMPKPGAWMETFKHWMALPLYATCIWLLWVVGNQTSASGMAIILLGCLLIVVAVLLHGESNKGESNGSESTSSKFWSHGKRGLTAACLLMALFLLDSPLLAPKLRSAQIGTENWHPYSAQLLKKIRATNQAVFIDMTADWCITCLANKKIVLDTEEVQQAFNDKGVVYLQGDWTNHNPEITELLRRYGRNGIPLYLLYPADSKKDATILPQILTISIIKDALSSL